MASGAGFVNVWVSADAGEAAASRRAVSAGRTASASRRNLERACVWGGSVAGMRMVSSGVVAWPRPAEAMRGQRV
jgi:hypothetical protein